MEKIVPYRFAGQQKHLTSHFFLNKVCEGLVHFARNPDGSELLLPIFPGLKGPEITRSLSEVKDTFLKNLKILKNVKHTILDVKVSEIYVFWTQMNWRFQPQKLLK